MRAIEFSLIILIAAFSSGCVLQIPAQPQREYTIIVLPGPDTDAASKEDDQHSEDAGPREQLKHEFHSASGILSEPQLHPVELSTDRDL